MANTYNFYEPQRSGTSTGISPLEQGYIPAQNAAFNRGDILQLITTGSATLPNPNGSIAATVGPTVTVPVSLNTSATTVVQGPVTIAAATSSGAPGLTYFVYLTYTGAGSIEGTNGNEFLINCAPGLVPTITVTNVGAPANTTGNGVYVGVYPSQEVQQAVTAFASTTTLTYPLADSIGANRSVTNPVTNILGVAINSSFNQFFSGVGGSVNVNPNAQFGATMNFSPLSPGEELLVYVDKFQGGQRFEFSLKQPFFPPLLGQTAGLTLDAASGIWVLDTGASNKIMTITAAAQGVLVQPFGQPVQVATAGPGDIGARVIAYVNLASALI